MQDPKELLDKYFPVLDHGFVALVDYMGSDAAIERAARVSYGKGTRATSDTRALIRYLLRNKHTSPLESVIFTFHIAAPIFVFRQIHRHRTARINEMSGRYSEMPKVAYLPQDTRLKKQSIINKQGSATDLVESPLAVAETMTEEQRQVFSNYEWYLDNDLSRELARINLPLGTYSQMYWQMDLHNLMHFLNLRLDSHAQEEVRVYGDVIAGIAKVVAPLAMEAWEDYSLNSLTLSWEEQGGLSLLLKTDSDYAVSPALSTKREQEEWASKLNTILFRNKKTVSPLAVNDALTPEQAYTRLFGTSEVV